MKKTLLISLAFLSIAGIAYAQLAGTVRILDNQWITDDKQIQMGNFPDVACEYDTNQTNDAMVCGLSADSERLIITQKADMGTNFGLTDLGSPGITFMSSDATRSGTIYNDGTNLVIDVSAGSVSVPDGITGAIIGNADTATALAANPSDCSTGQYATTIAANGNLTCAALDANDGNITNVGDISLDSILSDATNGQIVIGGAGGASNNERLTFDFETVANKATLSSSTGVTQVDFGSIGLKSTGGLDLSGSNINGANQILANGDITSADTGDIGWSRMAAANQACNTTCTFACVFGQEGTSKDILACSDATADVCVCAGAN